MNDFQRYPRPSLTIDLAIVTVHDSKLKVVLIKRGDAAQVGGDWALPGGFVRLGEAPDEAVARVLRDKTRIEDAHFEQLATYGDPARDPRGHVVSIVYLALVPDTRLLAQFDGQDALSLAEVRVGWAGEAGGTADAMAGGADLKLAFDHAGILGDMVKRLRGKLDYTSVGFALLDEYFTLRDAQEVHEAILGRPLAKPAFRRKLTDRHNIQPTGRRKTGGAYRPAELYRVVPAGKE